VTHAGRVIGTVWGLFGVVLVSGLTATLASQLTAHQLAPTVHGPDDLPKVRVAVVEHTAGVRYTDRHGIKRKTFPDVDQALTALDRDEVDVVINDAPSLAYAGENAHPHIRVLPGTFLNHGYAFGMRPDAPYRHELNRALLKVTSDDAFRSLIAHYLGQAD
jgi:polar amino acid transport system substrate-binding protein